MFLLYKKHFVGKHTYRQYGQGGAHSRTGSPKNSHSYMLNNPPPMWTLTKSQQITTNKLLNRKVNPVNKISGYKYIQIFQLIQRANKCKIHCKKHREIREHKKQKIVILWALVLIFLTNHSSYNYSVSHTLLNMQNIYISSSVAIWKLLITHVSSLNITTVFPLTTPILHPFSCHRRDSSTWN
jgi:hypothetical protein